MALVTVACIGRTYGLDGEFHTFAVTDFPDLRFKKGNKLVLVDKNGNMVKMVTIKSYRPTKGNPILSLKDYPSIEEIEKIRGYELAIEEEIAPLPEGYYRIKELGGCQVIDDETERVLGEVEDGQYYGPTPTFRVKRKAGPDFFVPFVYEEFVVLVDLPRKTIRINVIPGLI